MKDLANERGTNDSLGSSFRSITSPIGNAEIPKVKKAGLSQFSGHHHCWSVIPNSSKSHSHLIFFKSLIIDHYYHSWAGSHRNILDGSLGIHTQSCLLGYSVLEAKKSIITMLVWLRKFICNVRNSK